MVSAILPERIVSTFPDGAPDGVVSDDAAHASARLKAHIAAEIEREGFMPFSRFMHLALYAPGMGYYAAGGIKLGPQGDYVTAPEISSLFSRALARQVRQAVYEGLSHILELGAGTGRMAYDLLSELTRQGIAIERYAILEVSGELRERQRRTLERLPSGIVDRIEWLDTLPDRFSGVVLGNEVLDALPVELLRTEGGRTLELGVGYDHDSGEFVWRARLPVGELASIAAQLHLPDGYTTEAHLSARALMRTIAERLERGVALFIDYGFPRSEYYHPDRRQGTLMCHYRHRVHGDPFVLVGLQDITAHLDFTAVAEAARDGGLDLLGYASQAQFLINCGIVDLMQAIDPAETAKYAAVAAGLQRLLSPAEMGELVKAIAFGRGVSKPLIGFHTRDRSRALQ